MYYHILINIYKLYELEEQMLIYAYKNLCMYVRIICTF